MGGDSPQTKFEPKEPKKKSLLPFILGGAVLLIVCALQWSDVVEYIDGEPRLTAKQQKREEQWENAYNRNKLNFFPIPFFPKTLLGPKKSDYCSRRTTLFTNRNCIISILFLTLTKI